MGVNVSKIQLIKLMDIARELGALAAMEELQKMMDGFKYSNALIVRKAGDHDIELVKAHWEFIPVWIRTMDEVKAARKQGIPWLNATSEKLLESKMFRDAALKRRCLVIASHFYEWRHYKPESSTKDIAYPYVVGVDKADYFYMAGIWQSWTDKETGETLDTFAIVTTRANPLVERIHNKKKRMPTILTEELAYEWIMNDLSKERIKEIAAFQLPAEKMFAHPIAKDFKFAEDATAEFKYVELPALGNI
jgi:putative SOS response-associated peptidase YedK